MILFEKIPKETYVTQPLYLLLKEKWDNIWSGPENKFLVPFTFEDGYPGWFKILTDQIIILFQAKRMLSEKNSENTSRTPV